MFPNLGVGNYATSVKDAKSCFANSSLIISSPGIALFLELYLLWFSLITLINYFSELLEITAESIPVVCKGEASGQIQARGSGGVPPYNFCIFSSPINSTCISGTVTGSRDTIISGLSAATYTVWFLCGRY